MAASISYSRSILKLLIKRVKEKRRFIQVIVGPRQVGKSYLMREIQIHLGNTKCTIINADESIFSSNWIEENWNKVRILSQRSKAKEHVLIIDEIQKIKHWSDIVKGCWDEDSRTGTMIKIVLTGSSRLLMQQGLSESMTGRFETIYVPHWSFSELKSAFDYSLDEYISWGSYPGAVELFRVDEKRAKQYIRDSFADTSINKDILMMQKVDKPALLKKLFEIASNYSSQIVSFNKILGELTDAGNTTTLSNYSRLLDSAGLITGIEKYASKIIRQRSSIPKWQVQNNALMNAFSPLSMIEVKKNPELWGRWVESAVGSHLINSSKEKKWDLYYWRENNMEVDFVLSYKEKLVCLEIKSARAKNPKGIQAFKESFPVHRSYLVGGHGISLGDFLSIDPLELF